MDIIEIQSSLYVSMRKVILMILLSFFLLDIIEIQSTEYLSMRKVILMILLIFFFIGYHRNTVYCTCKHEDSDTDDTVEVLYYWIS